VFDAEANSLRLPAYGRLIDLMLSARGDSTQTLYVYLIDTVKGEDGCFQHPRYLKMLHTSEQYGEPGCLRGPFHKRCYTTLRFCAHDSIHKVFFGGVESNFKPFTEPVTPQGLGCVSQHMPPGFHTRTFHRGEGLIQGVKSPLAAQWPGR
jgi:hypothetical protein